MENLQHPDVTAAERTGYAPGRAPAAAFRCDECGEDVRVGEAYYEVGARRYCRRCVELFFLREAAP